MKISILHLLFLAVLAITVLTISGCSTEDPENNSARPWNSPQNWEGGMPLMDQQRH